MQEPSEDLDVTVCAQCGEELSPELERGFTFGEDQALCFACATARGGVYDELEDHWVEAPKLDGLTLTGEHAPLP